MNAAQDWILKDYFPEATLEYCFQLFNSYPYEIKVVAPRATKLGDYRFNPQKKSHLITINRNLNTFQFLMVYLHEVAHCLTALDHGFKVKPHGEEWKTNLRKLIDPVLLHQWLPLEIAQALQHYLINPKASTCNHPQLTQVLRKYDPPNQLVSLQELPDGSTFSFRKRHYKRIGKRRTRICCMETSTQRMYLFSRMTQVNP